MRRAFPLSCLLALSFLASFTSAQPQSAPVLARGDDARPPAVAPLPPLPPALLFQPAEGKPSQPLKLVRVDVQVTIAGHVAETALTMTFRNDLNRVLEGNLVFPLPEGSTVAGYALDVEGQLVDASVVESQQARYIFETEQRKGIDPGLVEWVKGNNFQTRVWPIPAKGTRTVRVKYLTELASTGGAAGEPGAGKAGAGKAGASEPGAGEPGAGKAVYGLPLKYQDALEKLSVSIRVHGTESLELSVGNDWLKSAKADKDWIVTGELTNAKPKQDVFITLPAPPQQTAIGTGPRGKGHYFVIRDQPKAPAVRWEPPTKGRVAIYFDASSSRAGKLDERELAALKAVIEARAAGAVDVIAFRDRMDDLVTFTVDPANPAAAADQIIRHLKQIPFDGGTNLGAVRVLKNYAGMPGSQATDKSPDYAIALLVTDGLDTLGDALPDKLEIPVYAFAADARANHPLLRHIAAKSGGAYFNLAATTIKDVIDSISHPPFAFLRAEFDAKEIADVLPATTQPVRGSFTVAGRLLVPQATITLHYAFGSQHPQSVKVTLRQADAAGEWTAAASSPPVLTGSLVARLWAQMKVDSLLHMPDKHREELIALGKQFSLVTPGTSMLVLERLEQYLEYGIEPPATRQKIRDEWLKQIELRQVQKTKSREEKLAAVAKTWDEYVKWWEREFKVPKGFVFDQAKRKNELTTRAMAIEREMLQAKGDERRRLQGELADAREQLKSLAQDREDAYLLPLSPRDGGPGAAPPNSPAPTPAPATTGRPPLADAAKDARPAGGEGGGRRTAGPRAATTLFAASKDDADGADAGGQPAAAIAIKAWDPGTPYLKAMQKAGAQNAYAVYLDQRHTFAASPAFYFDCANYFFSEKQAGGPALGVRVLTSVLDIQVQDPRLMRIVAYTLQQHGYLDMAIDLFEKVAKLRPEEPQSHRDLALALTERGDRLRTGQAFADHSASADPSAAMSDYLKALTLFNKIVSEPWDERFDSIEAIVLMEANRVMASVDRMPAKHVFENPIDPRFRKNLEADVRVVLGWDTDQTDIDLWVTEPSGEKCFYSHNRTVIGGFMSRDFTQGYGPEAYFVRKGMIGKYNVQANFYGSSQQTLTGGTTVRATVFTNFGRANEERQTLTIRLTTAKDVIDIGAVIYGADDATK